MDKPASKALVASEELRVKQWLVSSGWSENIAENFAVLVIFQRDAVAKIVERHLSYLPLPSVIASVAHDSLYQAALPHGRFSFYEGQLLEVDGEWFRCPEFSTRQDIADVIRVSLFPAELKLAAVLPLAWRVGFVVGWLSALDVVQKDDGKAGMVVLAALVAPLLSSSQKDMQTSVDQKSRKRLGPARK